MSEQQQAGGESRQRITYADVLASFNDRVRNQFFVRWLGRPAANRLTPLFFNAGWTANQVTALRVVVGALALVVLACAQPASLWLVTVAFYVCLVLDCLDGNLARLADNATYWGKFIDGLSDRFLYILAPFAAGIGVGTALGEPAAVAWGGAGALLGLYNEAIRTRVIYFRRLMAEQQAPPATRPAPAWLEGAELWIARLVTNLTFLAPLLLLHPAGLAPYFWLVLAAEGGGSAAWSLVVLARANRELRRHRRSMHAAGETPPAKLDFEP